MLFRSYMTENIAWVKDMEGQVYSCGAPAPDNCVDEEEMVSAIERLTSSVTPKDLLLFYRQLSTLVGAKIPIAPSLRTIHAQTENAQLRIVVTEVAADVEDGMSISESFAKHENVFTTLAVSMIRAGEVSGNLQGAIDFVAESAEQNYQLKSKVRGALMYPIFVISVAFVIGFLTMTWILPKLTNSAGRFFSPATACSSTGRSTGNSIAPSKR